MGEAFKIGLKVQFKASYEVFHILWHIFVKFLTDYLEGEDEMRQER